MIGMEDSRRFQPYANLGYQCGLKASFHCGCDTHLSITIRIQKSLRWIECILDATNVVFTGSLGHI